MRNQVGDRITEPFLMGIVPRLVTILQNLLKLNRLWPVNTKPRFQQYLAPGFLWVFGFVPLKQQRGVRSTGPDDGFSDLAIPFLKPRRLSSHTLAATEFVLPPQQLPTVTRQDNECMI